MKNLNLQGAKCKVWQERERTLLVNSNAPALIMHALPLVADMVRRLLVTTCLRHSSVSEELIADLITNAE